MQDRGLASLPTFEVDCGLDIAIQDWGIGLDSDVIDEMYIITISFIDNIDRLYKFFFF